MLIPHHRTDSQPPTRPNDPRQVIHPHRKSQSTLPTTLNPKLRQRDSLLRPDQITKGQQQNTNFKIPKPDDLVTKDPSPSNPNYKKEIQINLQRSQLNIKPRIYLNPNLNTIPFPTNKPSHPFKTIYFHQLKCHITN